MANLGKPRGAIVAVATSLWGLVVALGLLGMEREKGRPGEAGDPSRRWPSASVLPRDPTRPNLLLTLHPQCPCSDASLAEFARIMARCRGRAAGHVLFVKPGRTPGGWERTRLWRAAAALPDVRVSCDEGGREAVRFGALTSGQVALYDVAGDLRFSGGITPARGHQGDNPGVQAVLTLLLEKVPSRERNPVFGCPLFYQGPRW